MLMFVVGRNGLNVNEYWSSVLFSYC